MAFVQLDLWSKSDRDSAGQALVKPAPPTSSADAARQVARSPVPVLQPGTAHRAQFYMTQARADRTRAAYALDLQTFVRWCDACGLSALPASPETLSLYLTSLLERGRKLSTVKRARVAIGRAHAAALLPRPDRAEQVRQLERGMGRVHGTKEEGAPPLLHEHIAQITQTLRRGVRDDRDRALLLLGFWGAFRASELVALRIEDVTLEAARLRVLVRRSKEDQLGHGEVIAIDAAAQPELCAVRAVRAWLDRIGQSSGPLLRQVAGQRIALDGMQPRAVSRVVRRLALDAALGPDFSSHSLRAGLATSAYAHGVSEREIQRHGRWKDRRSLDRYIHPIAYASRPNIVAAFG